MNAESTSKIDADYLNGLMKAIELFRDFDLELQAQTMLTLLIVWKHGPISVQDVGEKLRMAHSTASRNISLLTTTGWRGEPGPRLLDVRVASDDSRRREITVNARGLKFLQMVSDAMRKGG
jgi:DNA-binding MarR family transcriptional regulator